MSNFKQLLENILNESVGQRRAIGALRGFSTEAINRDMSSRGGPSSKKGLNVNTKSNRIQYDISTPKELNDYINNHLHTGHTLIISNGNVVGSIHPKGENKFLIRDHNGQVVRHEVNVEKEKTVYSQRSPIGGMNHERILTPKTVKTTEKELSSYHNKEDSKNFIHSMGKHNLQLHHVS